MLPGIYLQRRFRGSLRSSDGGLTGKNARRMMMHLSIPIDDDLQQTLSFFVKVGVEEKDVGRMLIKYPWILSMSIQENFKEVSSFFELEKVPKLSVGRAIRSWPHILGCSTSMLKLMVEEIGELGIRNKKLDQVISRSPQLLIWKPQEFLQKILVWLFHEFPFYIEDEIPKNLFVAPTMVMNGEHGQERKLWRFGL
ncbi:uncharacterized protein LOC103967657 isoform X2 [Pyrus x bretschneideri]|uniref:uncharacterized protein LOC103967657 isoform X2 n=1 Tax=Pyrus x bretschneideri TaxID=225117 RepID=UPI00202E79C8|nr:uncharacterized protein LOC103967657 isoform X2 [Pyrus x bretschneideri]